VDVNFFLSTDGAINSSAIPLNIPALQNRAVNIASGRSVTLTGSFKAGKYPSANYHLIAQAIPVSGLTADQLMSTPSPARRPSWPPAWSSAPSACIEICG